MSVRGWGLVMVLLAGEALPAYAEPLRRAAAPRLAQCHFSADQDAALLVPGLERFDPALWLPRFLTVRPAPAATGDDDAGDDGAADDDDDSEETTEDDEADPPVRNFIAFQPSQRGGHSGGTGPCMRISGGFAASATLTDGTSAAGRMTGRSQDRLTSETRATIGFQIAHDTEWGRSRAVIELEWSDSAGTTTGSAGALWLSLGAVTLGLKGSGFDFWSGDEFGFRATAPSSTTPLLSLMLATGKTGRLLVGLEDNQARRMVGNGYSAHGLPDLVLRWQNEGEGLTLHAAGAFRWLNLVGYAGRPGYAGIFGVRRDIPGIGTDSYALGQITYADSAPGYLGIAQPGGLLRFTLPRNGPAFVLETIRGWTGALAYSHGWSERWRSNAFVTYADLRLPEGPTRGRIHTGRAAVNLVWTPLAGLDITWELGASRIYRLDTMFTPFGYPRHPSYTAQMAIARKF